MIIKKYQGKTEEEATNLAKKELGEGIVVMNVKTIKPKGFLSFLRSSVVEVTVAKEEEDIVSKKASEEQSIREAISSVDKLRSESEHKIDLTAGDSNKDSQELEKKVDTIQSLLENKLLKNEEAKKETEKKLAPQMAENPSPAKADSFKENPDPETLSFMKLLYNTIVDNEVSQQYANQMVEEIEQNYSKNMQMEDILSHIYQKMILKFGKANTITAGTKKGPKVIYFIGPTGVGKTTTLAKIASKLILSENKKVALFTADTYRISAKDQLKTYADILETPFEVIYENENGEASAESEDLNEFAKFMESKYTKYPDYDYILVDTAGHSHTNEQQREKMKNFIHSLDSQNVETEVYLVLSATTKYKDLISIVDTYSQFADYKLIFTKLDETSSYGNLFNVKIHTGAPMSYITKGQNVPDDIDIFDPQDIVRKLLGGNA